MKPRILVVDDNRALADNIAELLEELSDDVIVCMNGAEARRAARQGDFRLAFVDVRLPDISDGLALVPELRSRSHHAEFIMITGNATLDTAIAAVRHGVFAYVQKPFEPEKIQALAERALTQAALRYEREELARELANSERQYRGLIETIEALIFELDSQGRILYANRFGAERAGLDRSTSDGIDFASHCFPPDDQPPLRKAVRDAHEGATTRDLELPFGSARSSKTVRWTIAPLVREGSSSTGSVLASGIDVTEERALRSRAAENEALAAMGVLTTGLAHEIRNPLNAAKLQLEVLYRRAQRLDKGEAREAIESRARVVQTEIQRLSQLLDDFLSLARPRGIGRSPVHLSELFRDVATLQVPQAREHRLSLEASCAEDLTVMGDFGKLKQVLINLVGNALEAMREQGSGKVRLEASPINEREIRIRVIDTGPGLAHDVANQVFKPFVTTKEAGTGLGLSIVQKIVEQHRGTVELMPGEDGGLTVELVLPRHL